MTGETAIVFPERGRDGLTRWTIRVGKREAPVFEFGAFKTTIEAIAAAKPWAVDVVIEREAAA